MGLIFWLSAIRLRNLLWKKEFIGKLLESPSTMTKANHLFLKMVNSTEYHFLTSFCAHISLCPLKLFQENTGKRPEKEHLTICPDADIIVVVASRIFSKLERLAAAVTAKCTNLGPDYEGHWAERARHSSLNRNSLNNAWKASKDLRWEENEVTVKPYGTKEKHVLPSSGSWLHSWWQSNDWKLQFQFPSRRLQLYAVLIEDEQQIYFHYHSFQFQHDWGPLM